MVSPSTSAADDRLCRWACRSCPAEHVGTMATGFPVAMTVRAQRAPRSTPAMTQTADPAVSPALGDGPSPLTAAVERIPTTVYPSAAVASKAVAQEIADLIRSRAARGERAVLGLATGSTPTRVYDELVRMHKQDGLSFKNV